MYVHFKRLAAITFFFMSFGVVSTQADPVVVVPNANTNIGGNGALAGGARIQQVFGSSQFTALGGPILITQIAFRPDAQMGTAFTHLNPSLQINFSTTNAAPDGLSTTFANNVGADDTVVLSGSVTYGSANTGPAGGPRDFDIVFVLSTPFFYDPSLGNLLLDIRTINFTGSTFWDAQSTNGDSVSLINGLPDSATALQVTTTGLVTQFTYTPVAVPEPATLLLLGTGIFFGLNIKRLRRTPR